MVKVQVAYNLAGVTPFLDVGIIPKPLSNHRANLCPQTTKQKSWGSHCMALQLCKNTEIKMKYSCELCFAQCNY